MAVRNRRSPRKRRLLRMLAGLCGRERTGEPGVARDWRRKCAADPHLRDVDPAEAPRGPGRPGLAQSVGEQVEDTVQIAPSPAWAVR